MTPDAQNAPDAREIRDTGDAQEIRDTPDTPESPQTPTAPPSRYAAKPWLARLTPVQRAPAAPLPSVLHAFRAAVARAPGRTALAYFDGRLDYAEADALSDSLAGHLAAQGIGRGDRVAVMLQNTPHFVLAVLAAWKAGAVVVPLNPMYKSGEVGHILRDSGAAALVCDARAWPAYLREAAYGTGVRLTLTASDLDFQTRDDVRVLAPGPRPEQAADAADLAEVARRGHPAPPDPGLTAADTALISYTSGTSGTPKGAMNPHGALTHNATRQVTGHPIPEGTGYFALAPSSTSPAWSASSPPASPTPAPSSSPTASTPAWSSTPSSNTAPPTPWDPPPPSWRSPPNPESPPSTSPRSG